jgi:hypothetical protein
MMAGVAEVLALIGEMEQANQIARGFRILSLDAAPSAGSGRPCFQ